MKFQIIRQTFLLSFALCSLAFSETYVHEVALDPGKETADSIVTKAANVVPSPQQMDFQNDAFSCFVHFGPNTFTGVEWGSGKEDGSVFNPGEKYSTDQWCETAKAAGMKIMLITVKHHDGFCTWQTRYNTEHSVKSIPWKNGKGDVLRDLSNSCKKFGLKLGVYLSPADLYQLENEKGLYGNGSGYRKSTIPTDPTSFLSDPTKIRADRSKDAPIFTVEADDYNRYFMNQLYEILTEYGSIHEVWFDGATPKTKGGQTYTKEKWFEIINKLAPEAVIFGGPDVRWCGNEGGHTRDAEYNVLPVEGLVDSGVDRTDTDLGSNARLAEAAKRGAKFLYYIVPETDTSIRSGWFWRNETEQTVRSANDVFDIYERATGGNGIFLLNVPPSKDGLMGERDVATLTEVGKRIRATYGNSVLMQGASSDQAAVLDGKIDTYWQADSSTGEFTVSFPSARKFNRVVLQEAIGNVGQRVIRHALDAKIDGKWKEIATAQVIGFRRILRFPEVETDAFRVRILDARLQPTVAKFSAHYYQPPAPSVEIIRNNEGLIVIQAARESVFTGKSHGQEDDSIKVPLAVHYTLDGTNPTALSPVFTKPLDIPAGGNFKAAAIAGGKIGPITETRISISKTGWKIQSVTSEESADYSADKAIDGNPATMWHSSWTKNTPHPHTLVIDLGRPCDVTGFTYLPRQDKAVPDGMIATGEVSTSPDGSTWSSPQPFTFGNLVNDPSERTFTFFAKPIRNTRYLRIVTKSGEAGKPYAAAAEIGVLGS